MSKNLNEGRVYFSLDSEVVNPSKIQKVLNVPGAVVIHKGSKANGILPRHNSWRLSTETVVAEILDIYTVTLQLVEKLIPYENTLKQVIQEYDLKARLEVVLWFSKDESISMPILGFDAKIINFLSEVGAYIDVDTYRNL